MAEEFARLVAVMEAQLRGFTKGMEQAQRIADQRFGAIELRMRKTENTFASGFKNIGSLVARYLSTAALISFGRSVLQNASALKEQAESVNQNVEEFQAFVAIMRDGGASAAQAGQALNKLNTNLGEAKQGAKQAREDFQRFGISVDDLIRMNPAQALQAVAQGALSIADASQRADALTKIFGERVARFLIPALADLAKGAATNVAAMKELGRVMSEETLGRADAAIDKLSASWDRLAAAAAPALTFIVERLSEIIRLASLVPEGIGKAASDIARGGTREDILNRENRNPTPPNRGADTSSPLAKTLPLPQRQAELPDDLPPNLTVTPNKVQAVLDAIDAAEKSNELAADKIAEHLQRHQAFQEFVNEAPRILAERVREAVDGGAIEDLTEPIQRAIRSTVDGLDEAERRAQEFGDTIRARVIGDISQMGAAALIGADNFGEAIGQMLKSIAQLIIQLEIAKALESSFGTGTGGSILGGLGKLLGFAKGGVTNRPSIFGESGPEAAVPLPDGRNIPVKLLNPVAARSPSITMTFTNQNSFAGAVDANSMRAYADQVGAISAKTAVNMVKQNFPGLVANYQKRQG